MTQRLAAMLMAFVWALSPVDVQGQKVSFSRDVFPILADRCFTCHGPDGEDRKAKLRLDKMDGVEGAYRVRKGVAAIKPGSLEESELWARVTSTDTDERMPPKGSHKKPLTKREQEIIRKWILAEAAQAAIQIH